MFVREAAQFLDDLLQFRRQHVARGAQHARISEVVDVFGSAAEVHQFEQRGSGAAGREFLAYEIFHGLDVVVDARLDGFHGCRRIITRFERQARRQLAHGLGQRLREDLRHGLRQRQQPGRFDADALADQPAFRQHGAQGIRTLAVSAIDGRERGKCGGIHVREASAKCWVLDWGANDI